MLTSLIVAAAALAIGGTLEGLAARRRRAEGERRCPPRLLTDDEFLDALVP